MATTQRTSTTALWLLLLLPQGLLSRAAPIMSMEAYRLTAMRRRAELLATCVEAKREELSSSTTQRLQTYEVTVCAPLRVAFVHVYKAAGTTVLSLLTHFCPEQVDIYSSWGSGRGRLDDRSAWRRALGNVTVVTVVRDPLERFQSGVFEVSSRGRLTKQIQRAFDENATVSSVVIDDLRSHRASRLSDPHLQPQLMFLVDRAALVAEFDYVAVVSPMLPEALVALGVRLLGLDRSELETYVRSDHARDSSDATYAGNAPTGPFGGLRHEKLDRATKAKVYDYYRADYECFGFD